MEIKQIKPYWQCRECGEVTEGTDRLEIKYYYYGKLKMSYKTCPKCGSRRIECISMPVKFNFNDVFDTKRNLDKELDEGFMEKED